MQRTCDLYTHLRRTTSVPLHHRGRLIKDIDPIPRFLASSTAFNHSRIPADSPPIDSRLGTQRRGWHRRLSRTFARRTSSSGREAKYPTAVTPTCLGDDNFATQMPASSRVSISVAHPLQPEPLGFLANASEAANLWYLLPQVPTAATLIAGPPYCVPTPSPEIF